MVSSLRSVALFDSKLFLELARNKDDRQRVAHPNDAGPNHPVRRRRQETDWQGCRKPLKALVLFGSLISGLSLLFCFVVHTCFLLVPAHHFCSPWNDQSLVRRLPLVSHFYSDYRLLEHRAGSLCNRNRNHIMTAQRRLSPFLFALFLLFFFFIIFHTTNLTTSLRHVPKVVGLVADEDIEPENVLPDLRKPKNMHSFANPNPAFVPGTVKNSNAVYTKTLVIGQKKEEDTYWIQTELEDMLAPKGPLNTAIYVVDDNEAALHTPKNKGHEAMVYLTYIIENYNNLSDVTMFMHAHRFAWHNNDILNLDSALIIRNLNPNHVIRHGYVNLRCHWAPGCPAETSGIHPGALIANAQRQEEKIIAEAWSELFPLDPIPPTLSQPCCAQFALSRERIQAIPLSQYIYYRDWLLKTPLPDRLSGRVFEQIWIVIFGGVAVDCPAMNICYCDGYGICFGSAEKYDEWFDVRFTLREHEEEMRTIRKNDAMIEEAKYEGRIPEETDDLVIPEPGRKEWIHDQIDILRNELNIRRAEAWERGKDPRNRAAEAGREWKEGDGF